MRSKLVPWLISELDERGWSHRELARRAGFSQTTVSQVIAENRSPTWDFCAGVAQALGVPVDEVFTLAGLKRPLPPPVAEEREVLALLRGLSDGVRQVVLTILRALARGEPEVAIPARVYEPPVGYRAEDEAWIRELVEELRQVPEDWRQEAVRQIQFVARMASRPAVRMVGEDEGERDGA